MLPAIFICRFAKACGIFRTQFLQKRSRATRKLPSKMAKIISSLCKFFLFSTITIPDVEVNTRQIYYLTSTLFLIFFAYTNSKRRFSCVSPRRILIYILTKIYETKIYTRDFEFRSKKERNLRRFPLKSIAILQFSLA